DKLVTGVQTCALPISIIRGPGTAVRSVALPAHEQRGPLGPGAGGVGRTAVARPDHSPAAPAQGPDAQPGAYPRGGERPPGSADEIGRASCRERVCRAV